MELAITVKATATVTLPEWLAEMRQGALRALLLKTFQRAAEETTTKQLELVEAGLAEIGEWDIQSPTGEQLNLLYKAITDGRAARRLALLPVMFSE